MKTPKYRKNSSRNRAFIEWHGKRHYLPGAFGSGESTAAYRRFLAENVLGVHLPELPKSAVTVARVAASYLAFALRHYGPGSRGEFANVKAALKPFARAHGAELAEEFGPSRLKAYRENLVAKGLSRAYINQTIAKIKRAFKWAASEELISPVVSSAFSTVAGLQAGRTAAKETPKKTPVHWEQVAPVLAELNPVVADMLRFQWHTGARSKSICLATPAQFMKEGDLWLWRPRHKTEYRGKELVIPIGPKCQAVLEKYMNGPADAPLFDPRRRRKNRRYGRRYTTTSYYRAIYRAQERVNANRDDPLPRWSPHQVRHSKGHAIRSQYGIEAVQAVLGHDSIDASQIYSEPRLELAKRIARELG